jgi:hypothetical protein
MKLSRNRFPHLAAGAAALPFASRVAGKLYAEVMETQLWQSNVGIAEFGQHNLHHLGSVCANNSDSDVSAKKSADQRMRHKCVRSAELGAGQAHRCPMSSASSKCYNRRRCAQNPLQVRFA